MPFKILLGAVIGGALMFGAGYIEHEQLKWGTRQMKGPKDVSSLLNCIKSDCPEPGVYFAPLMTEDLAKKTAEEQKQIMEKAVEELNQGRYTLVISPKAGQGFKWTDPFLYEGVSNIIACFLASLVVAMTSRNIGFVGRWFVVVLIGLFSWASVNASYYIWYHFPWEWVQDELMCAALEAAMAGVAIAAIVVPRPTVTPGF